MQFVIVSIVVAVCSVYALWILMPGAARRALARAMLNLRLPEPFAQRLRKASTAAAGCGCDGCDAAPARTAKAASTAPQVVTFHPRPPR